MPTWLRWLCLTPFIVFIFGPLLAMLDFSTRDPATGDRTLTAWKNIFANDVLYSALIASLLLAVSTVLLMLVILVPTMIWVRLRVPWAKRLIEFLCLLPLTIPALVIVVGLHGVYTWVTYYLGDSVQTLALVYTIFVLPFAYRAIDGSLSSIDATTLAEAARSLGASWTRAIVGVIVPNIWPGIVAAAFISIAVVLGEYTVASLMGYTNLQVAVVAIGQESGPTAVATSLGTLLFGATLLLVLAVVTGRRRGGKADTTTPTLDGGTHA